MTLRTLSKSIFRSAAQQASTAPSSHWRGARRTLGTCLVVGTTFFALAALAMKGHPLSAVVWGLALFAVGLFFGFLFGHPRASASAGGSTNAANAPESSPTPPKPGAQAPAPATSVAGSTTRAASKTSGLTPTGSLDEIAEWLTKMIVGVTLVELRNVPSLLGELSMSVGNSLAESGGAAPFHALSVGAILFFWTIGFIFGYLWLRLRLQTAIGQSDIDLARVQDEARAEGALAASASLAATSPGLITNTNAPLTASINRLWNSDPNKDQFGGSSTSKSRVLKAVLSPALPGSPDLIAAMVDLEVCSTDPTAPPLTDPVTFVLHPTFNQPERLVLPINGVARLRIHQAWGAFTVGVRADKGSTLLELDLATVAGAPQGFYAS